jgi:hypothetical protein
LAHGLGGNAIRICPDKNDWRDQYDISYEELVREIRSDPEYNPTVHINLIFCHSATGENSIAERIHRELGNTVSGFDGLGGILGDGSFSPNRRHFGIIP